MVEARVQIARLGKAAGHMDGLADRIQGVIDRGTSEINALGNPFGDDMYGAQPHREFEAARASLFEGSGAGEGALPNLVSTFNDFGDAQRLGSAMLRKREELNKLGFKFT
ncbi:MAG: hypothetical protein HOQ24_17200 [Mycobacteriaceae bacterium]|nr:hypothetical protein [Mycobacteriaceae bacterium]